MITTPSALAVRKVSTTIPIVHPAAIDPVGTGLVASLAHPGGNVTGLAVLNAELSANRLGLLREILPQISLVALLWNSANPANTLAWKETESAARALGIGLRYDEVRDVKDFDSAFAAIAEQRPDALLVLQDALTLQYRKQIVEFALRTRLPSMFVGKEWVQDGGLMSYGDRLPERYRRAAQIIDRILKGGEKPADIPVDQPTIFELAVNLKTAKAIEIKHPASFPYPRRRGDRMKAAHVCLWARSRPGRMRRVSGVGESGHCIPGPSVDPMKLFRSRCCCLHCPCCSSPGCCWSPPRSWPFGSATRLDLTPPPMAHPLQGQEAPQSSSFLVIPSFCCSTTPSTVKSIG